MDLKQVSPLSKGRGSVRLLKSPVWRFTTTALHAICELTTNAAREVGYELAGFVLTHIERAFKFKAVICYICSWRQKRKAVRSIFFIGIMRQSGRSCT